MGRFIIRRFFSMIVVLFAISIFTFLIFQAIPNGDPAERMAGRKATPETVAAIRKDWGFDQPLYEQYLKTMKRIGPRWSGSLPEDTSAGDRAVGGRLDHLGVLAEHTLGVLRRQRLPAHRRCSS